MRPSVLDAWPMLRSNAGAIRMITVARTVQVRGLVLAGNSASWRPNLCAGAAPGYVQPAPRDEKAHGLFSATPAPGCPNGLGQVCIYSSTRDQKAKYKVDRHSAASRFVSRATIPRLGSRPAATSGRAPGDRSGPPLAYLTQPVEVSAARRPGFAGGSAGAPPDSSAVRSGGAAYLAAARSDLLS